VVTNTRPFSTWDWRVRELAVRLAGGRTLALAADGAGNWTDGAGRPLPELSVTPLFQAYTRLAPGRYLFESPEHAFSAEVGTDDERLVLDYPGLFARHTP
jgi:hypothetical protein